MQNISLNKKSRGSCLMANSVSKDPSCLFLLCRTQCVMCPLMFTEWLLQLQTSLPQTRTSQVERHRQEQNEFFSCAFLPFIREEMFPREPCRQAAIQFVQTNMLGQHPCVLVVKCFDYQSRP